MPRSVPALSALPLAGLAFGMTLGMGGCQSNPDDVSFQSVKGNLTPELQTLDERPSDVDRNLAVNFNQDLRMFWMDLGRTFYTDRPSYLSPMPVVATGGQGR